MTEAVYRLISIGITYEATVRKEPPIKKELREVIENIKKMGDKNQD